MADLLPTFSPRWLLAFAVTAAFWIGAALLAAYINTGQPPVAETIQGASVTLAVIAAIPALFGFFGGRLAFLGAHLGLLAGYVFMVRSFGQHGQGFEDLAAVAMFLLLGAAGLVLGLVADIVRYALHRSRAAS
ncbi:MAG TPA: hypothetical protein VIK91_19055 [Nannocystis sp.]